MHPAKFVLSALALGAAALFSNAAAAATALTHADVDLHSGPGAKFVTLGNVGANSKVGVLWCGGADFDWCLIQFHSKQGWVSLSDLTGFAAAGSSAQSGRSGTQTGGTGKLAQEAPALRAAAPSGPQVTSINVSPTVAKAVGGGL